MSGLGSAGRWRGVSMEGGEAVSGHAAGPFGLSGLQNRWTACCVAGRRTEGPTSRRVLPRPAGPGR